MTIHILEAIRYIGDLLYFIASVGSMRKNRSLSFSETGCAFPTAGPDFSLGSPQELDSQQFGS